MSGIGNVLSALLIRFIIEKRKVLFVINKYLKNSSKLITNAMAVIKYTSFFQY
jgi:hypothetical protein